MLWGKIILWFTGFGYKIYMYNLILHCIHLCLLHYIFSMSNKYRLSFLYYPAWLIILFCIWFNGYFHFVWFTKFNIPSKSFYYIRCAPKYRINKNVLQWISKWILIMWNVSRTVKIDTLFDNLMRKTFWFIYWTFTCKNYWNNLQNCMRSLPIKFHVMFEC